jgi:hypothetical protein
LYAKSYLRGLLEDYREFIYGTEHNKYSNDSSVRGQYSTEKGPVQDEYRVRND